ncbi:MAG: ABC transporter permease [Chloroflexota bacterium]
MTGRRTLSLARIRSLVLVPFLAIVLALIAGAVVMILSSPLVSDSVDLLLPVRAYAALFQGAFGSVDAWIKTLANATPLILAGFAVGIGFKAGLFNIGAQGQFLVGALGATAVALALNDASPVVAIPLSLLGGMAGGLLYGMIPGVLKAFSGAHEVVTTIMLNYVAIFLVSGVIGGPLRGENVTYSRTDDIQAATLPIFLGGAGHIGILFAAVSVPIVWWFLFRSTIGFEVRTTGANSEAARYAGMNPRWLIIFTLSLCGLFAGLAGATEILGDVGYMPASFSTTVGFDAIAVALLGRANPVGILFAGLLFGALQAGAGPMQIQAGIPVQIVSVLQAVILFFLTAEVLVRQVFRLKSDAKAPGELANLSGSYAARR